MSVISASLPVTLRQLSRTIPRHNLLVGYYLYISLPTIQLCSTQTPHLRAAMSTDKKLTSPEELLDLYNDVERLKNYKYFQPVEGSSINNEGFYMDLPYEEIK